MDYGVRWRHVGRAALLGAGAAALLSVVAAVGLTVDGDWSLWSATLLLVGWVVIPSLFVLVIGFVALFRVRVRGGVVEHVFAGVHVIRRRQLSRFVRTDFADTSVVFEDGSRIRLAAMEPDEFIRLTNDLRAAAPAAKAAEQAGCDRPPHPVSLAPAWLAWQDGAVRRIAEELAAEQKLDQLGILADALEDAGCANEALLSHLRSAGPHLPCCWALAVLLGKK
jgi:hypothetical protein